MQKLPGMRKAYEEVLGEIQGDIVITFSPDGNCIPELIPSLIETIKKGFDMVVVSRYLKEAISYDDDMLTAFGNRLITGLINLLFNAHHTDTLGIYRAYRAELVQELELFEDPLHVSIEKLFRTNLSWQPLMSIRVSKRGKKFTEIPGDEPSRIYGKRKLQAFKWGSAHIAQAFAEKFL